MPKTAPTVAAAPGALAVYVAHVAAALHLERWTVEVVCAEGDGSAYAQVDAPYGQRRATITVYPPFFDQTSAEQRDTVVHELAHLILMPAWQYVEELCDAELSVRASRIAWLAFTGHVEYAVDHLAGLLTPTVPLPPADR
jgi:hypothetical protein